MRVHRACLLATLLAGVVSVACDTPVYRYAMYRWRPAPYEVYYFHRDPIGDADRQLHESLDKAAQDSTAANVFVQAVDLAKDPELKSVPPDVRRLWQKQTEPSTPLYALVSPQGDPLHVGTLDDKLVGEMLESPVRKSIGQALEAGQACVLLVLSGVTKAEDGTLQENAEATEKAEAEARRLVADLNAGKIELELPPADALKAQDAPNRPSVQASVLSVRRTGTEEPWLVRNLLSVEPDLASLTDPMIFCIFGRGRALPPFIGKGITRENLLDCLQFTVGACSCTVKEQNPGLDLLVRYDWEKAAEKVAAKFGAEEGNEAFAPEDVFGQLSVTAVKPSDKPTEPQATAEPAKTDTEPAATPEVPESDPDNPSDERAVASADSTEAPDAVAVTPFASVYVIAGGVAAALCFLFVLTLLVLRPH